MTTIYLVGNGARAFTPLSTVSATVETWAAGAGGASNNFTNSSSAAGGGGGYSSSTVSLTAGTPVNFTLGAPGLGETASAAATSGGSTFFNGTTLAGSSVGSNGGLAISTGTTGGAGGSTTGAVGTIKNAGGNGGLGQTSGGGGGGGGSGGAAGNGIVGTAGVTGNVSGSSGGAGDNGSGGAGGSGAGSSSTPTGAAGIAAYIGGGGGQGGYAGVTATNGGTGGAGAFPGGGGGGGGTNANNGTLGGAGGSSLIAITYAGSDPDQIYVLGSLGLVLIPSSWTTNAIAEGWAGGGSGGAGGATGSGGSGGGGGYSNVNSLTVTAGGTLAVTVGAAGANTSIGASLVANHGVNGTAGAGGAGGGGGAAGTGNVTNAGGAGIAGILGADGAGGGGSSGTASGAGGNGNTGTTLTGGAGGDAPSAGAGGAGSAAGSGSPGTSDSRGGGGGGGGGIGTTVNGGAAGWPGGGGGGGGHGTTATGGTAAAGLIVLTKISSTFVWQQLTETVTPLLKYVIFSKIYNTYQAIGTFPLPVSQFIWSQLADSQIPSQLSIIKQAQPGIYAFGEGVFNAEVISADKWRPQYPDTTKKFPTQEPDGTVYASSSITTLITGWRNDTNYQILPKYPQMFNGSFGPTYVSTAPIYGWQNSVVRVSSRAPIQNLGGSPFIYLTIIAPAPTNGLGQSIVRAIDKKPTQQPTGKENYQLPLPPIIISDWFVPVSWMTPKKKLLQHTQSIAPLMLTSVSGSMAVTEDLDFMVASGRGLIIAFATGTTSLLYKPTSSDYLETQATVQTSQLYTATLSEDVV